MLTIKRTCSNKILTRALQFDGIPLVALLMPDAEDCQVCLDQDQLQAKLDSSPQATIIYNQQLDAIALVNSLRLSASQVIIEIRQDTKGVLGLHALRKQHGRRETLELIFQ